MVGLIEVYWCGWEIMSIMTSLPQAALTLHPITETLAMCAIMLLSQYSNICRRQQR